MISSNTIHGIGITDASGTEVIGNYIGVDAAGTTAKGNLGDGVRVGGTSSGTKIGTTATGSGNVIANNSGDGILVSSSSSTAASILQNSIYSNGEQGIDLGADDGLTYNDIADVDGGSNSLMNFPVLKTAISSGGNTTITGKVVAAASTSYRVEFFSNSYGIQDASGYGEARTYIGTVNVTTDASGIGVFSAVLTGVTLETGATVTATSSRLSAGTPVATSEFAGNILANQTNLMISGSYVGNGLAGRTYTGLGFRPEAVIIIQGSSTQIGVLRTSTMVGDQSKGSLGLSSNLIQSLDASGFTLGSSAQVNTSGQTYYFMAFGAGDNIDVGAYNGNGTSQTIAGVGFQAELTMFATAGSAAAKWNSSLSVSNTYEFVQTNPVTTGVTSYNSDGFAISSDVGVNASGFANHYIAFNQSSGYFSQGTYTGNGADNRNITGVGFEPEFMFARQLSGSNFVPFKTESTGFNTDLAIYADAQGNMTNTLQALQTDGFQVGNSTEVNGNGLSYGWFAFKQKDAPLIVDTTSDSIPEATHHRSMLCGPVAVPTAESACVKRLPQQMRREM